MHDGWGGGEGLGGKERRPRGGSRMDLQGPVSRSWNGFLDTLLHNKADLIYSTHTHQAKKGTI
jgi:hypothetical protein